jgi:hypothetical protein
MKLKSGEEKEKEKKPLLAQNYEWFTLEEYRAFP